MGRLGVVGVLFVLGLFAAGGAYVYSRRTSDDEAKNQADAAVATAAPTTAADPVSVAAAAPAPPSGASTAKRGDPKGAGTAAKAGAGAAAGAAPGGAAPTPAAAPTVDDEAAKNARLKQIAQGRCGLQQGELSRNDASNSGARNVKIQACLQASSLSPNSGSSNCERANCRTACTILKDQICLLQLDQAERSNPLKF